MISYIETILREILEHKFVPQVIRKLYLSGWIQFSNSLESKEHDYVNVIMHLLGKRHELYKNNQARL